MQNLSDHDIDKLFRQAAEELAPQFDSSDWEAMAKKLDSTDRVPRFAWWSGLVLILGVVSFVAWLGFSEELSENEVKANHQSAIITSSEKQIKSASSDPSVKKETESNLVDATDSLSNQHSSLARAAGSQQQSNHIARQSSGNEKRNNKKHGVPVSAIGINGIPEHNSKDENMPGENAIEFEDTIVITSQFTETVDSQIMMNAGIQSNSNSMDSLANGFHAQVADSSSNKKMSEDSKRADEHQPYYRLAVRAVLSPDYSSDNFNGSAKMGSNYGLEMHYFVNSQISLSAGVLRSQKYYTTAEAEYSIYNAENLSGDCYMWDIPLNMRYTFSSKRKTTAFLSAGFSSYLMSDENYSFEVEMGYGRQHYTMNVKNGNNEWFKMLNASIGLQRRVANHFALQLEPFVKIPLSGVGEGKVELSSFGCFFAVQYSFLSINRNK